MGSIVVDEAATTVPDYPTAAKTATSPSYAPLKAVRKFSGATIATSGSVTAGTTTILPQYNNDSLSDWTDLGTAETITADTSIDLTSIPTSGDGSDQVRFVITMDGDGTDTTLKVDMIAVTATFEEAYLNVFPNWGPTNGGNTVALELFNTTGLETPISVATDSEVLVAFDEVSGADAYESVQAATLTFNNANNFTRAVDGPLGNETTVGAEGSLPATEDFTTILDGSVAVTDPLGSGFVGTNVTTIMLDTDPAQVQYEKVVDIDESNNEYVGQRCVAPEAGEGFEIAATVSDSAYYLLKMRLKVETGDVLVTVDGTEECHFSSEDYSEARNLTLSHRHITGTLDVKIESDGGPATFQLAITGIDSYDSNYIEHTLTSFTSDPSDTSDETAGWGLDAFITVHGLPCYGAYAELFGVSNSSGDEPSIKVIVDRGGYVTATVDQNATETALTSNRPLLAGVRYNIAVAFYRRTDASTGYYVLLFDGEIVAISRTEAVAASVAYNQVLVGANNDTFSTIFTIGQLHFQNTPLKPETHAQSLGLADLFFQNTLQVPALTGDGSSTPKTLSLLHFNETYGPIVDDNAFWSLPTAEVIVTSGNRNKLTRGVDGIAGTGITMNEVGLDLLSSADFNPQTSDLAHSIFFYVAAMTPTTTSDIVNYVSSSDYGYSIQLDTSGYLVVNIFEGSTTPSRTETFNEAIVGDFSWHAIAVVLEPSTGRISITVDAVTVNNVGNTYSSYLTTGTFDYMHVGYGTYLTMDQFTVLEGALDQDTIEIWRLPGAIKGLPENDVFVNGVQLATDRVLPVDNRKCYVVMPEGTAGEAHISASFNGVTVSAQQPYNYIENYDRVIDQTSIPTGIQRTVSPFRILDTVPDGQVNLAYLDTRDISPDTNIQTIDLSDLDSDNLSNYLQGEFTMTSPATGVGTITYSGQLDTKDFNVSNRSAAWRSGTTPQPLFHKYLAGRGRYYVSAPGVEETDVDLIRRAILVVDESGQAFGREEFPWDIEVSSLDKNGNALPANVYSVVIFTRFPYLENETAFVSFRAADSLQSFAVQPGHREIINTVPIFTQVDSEDRDTYTLELQNDATYAITIRTT